MPAEVESELHVHESVQNDDFTSRQYKVALLVLITVGAFLRFWHLGTRGFFIDEGFSWAIAKLSWNEFFRTLASQMGEMPLHYLVMKLWITVGQSEFVLRIPSAIFGIVAIPVIADAGRKLYSRRAGIFAATFLTVHLFAIKYAQEARTYPMVLLMVALAWLQTARAMAQSTRRNWMWVSCFCILSVYSHLLAGLAVASLYATVLIFPTEKPEWRRIFESIGVTAVGVIPEVVFTLQHQSDVQWIHPTGFAAIVELLDNISGRSSNTFLICFVCFVFFAMMCFAAAVAFRNYRTWRSWAASIPICGVLFPVIGVVVVSLQQPIFVIRYLIFILVPLLLGLGWLFSRMPRRFAAPGVLVLVTAFVWPLPAYYQPTSGNADRDWQDFKGATQYVIDRERPGDQAIVYEPMARPAIEYYGSRSAGFPVFIFPRSADHFQARDMLMRPNPYELPGVMAKAGRVWMIYNYHKSPEETGDTPGRYLRRTLSKTHHLVSVQTFKSARVEEFVPISDALDTKKD